MNRMRKQIGDSRHDGLVTLQPRQPVERLRHDHQRKVPAARCCAGVAGMLGAVVVDLERHGRKVGEAHAQCGRNVGHDRSGRWRATDATVATPSRKKSPIAPQTLKLTHAAVEKFEATYRFAPPMASRKTTQVQVTRDQIESGRVRSFMQAAIRLRRKITLPKPRIAANSQYSTVGFHLMN